MESKEILSSLSLQVRDLTQQRRELLCALFLEELSLAEVALQPEDYRRLNSILEGLKAIPPLEGIAWALEELKLSSERGGQPAHKGGLTSFQDEGL
jgi:hypothetical protein